MSCVTAVTAQDTVGVRGYDPVAAELVQAQLDCVIADIGVDYVKIGMLPSVGVIDVVAETVERFRLRVLVDPVMVSTSGDSLCPSDSAEHLARRLLPASLLVTPNIPEAEVLLRTAGLEPARVCDLDSLTALALQLKNGLGLQAVLLKGGHAPMNTTAAADADLVVYNVLCTDTGQEVFATDYIATTSTHGTGCTLSAAIACYLAHGSDLTDAVRQATRFVHNAIIAAPALGHGHGPLNHMHSLTTLPFKHGGFLDYLLAHPKVRPLWKDYTYHPFVEQAASGTLPLKAFRFYLIQDYLFLIQYARANALASFKATSLYAIETATQVVTGIVREIEMHRSLCKKFGISTDELESSQESISCLAYTRYVLDIGSQRDAVSLQAVLAPCLIGYNVIATRLIESPSTLQAGNPYCEWIKLYVSPDYRSAVKSGSGMSGSSLLEQWLRDKTCSSPSQLKCLPPRSQSLSTFLRVQSSWKYNFGR